MGYLNLQKDTTKPDSVVENRDKYIGGSDIGQASTPAKISQLIRDKLNEPKSFKSIYTEYGNIAEPIIRYRLAKKLNKEIEDDKVYVEESEDLSQKMGYRANLDGWIESSETVIEIKTVDENLMTSRKPFIAKEKWQAYETQCGFYMGLLQAKLGMVAISPRPEFLIDKPFKQWTVKEMNERKSEIEAYVMTAEIKVSPVMLNDKLTDEIAYRMSSLQEEYRRQLGATASGDDDVNTKLLRYRELEKEASSIKTEMEELLESIASQFRDKQVWNIDDNDFVFTPASVSERRSFDSKKFEAEHTELYDKYIKVSQVKRKASLKVK